MESPLIEKSKLRVHVPAETWQDAISQAGKVLEEAGSITHGYVDEMIAAVEKFGPYIVLMPGFALAHSAPSPSVKREDIALVTLAQPVSFGSPNDPVQVVMCLSCVDHEAHLQALQRVALALDGEDIVSRMALAGDVDALFDVLHHQ